MNFAMTFLIFFFFFCVWGGAGRGVVILFLLFLWFFILLLLFFGVFGLVIDSVSVVLRNFVFNGDRRNRDYL